MNDNQPDPAQAPLPSHPLAADPARLMASLLAKTDGQRSIERLLAEMALLPSYDVVPQDNGMVALARLGGEGTMMVVPTALLVPLMAETILKFMLPKALHAAVKPGMGEAEIAALLSGGAL